MSDGDRWRDLTRRLTEVVIAGGALSVVTVFLGRLWTSTYFDYFGLPTSDLTLDANDYAFRTKEVLVMLLVAAGVAAGIVYKRGVLRVADGCSWTVALVGALAALAAFGVMAFREWRWVETLWRWLAVGLGLAVGMAIGILAAWISDRSGRRHLVIFAVLAVLLVGFVPPSIVRLARASASANVRTQNLAHAVIEFTGEAPQPIRRADDPTLSTRVYLVLLTPERIAVAFPYPCTHVATQAPSDRQVTVCDILTFDREQVRSVQIFGRGGRPANDTPLTAESVVLEVPDDDLSPRTVYHQGFDFAEAVAAEVVCDGRTLKDTQGVWLRLNARQAGRVELSDPTGNLRLYAASPADDAACRRVEAGRGVRLGAGDEVLLLVVTSAPDTDPRAIVELSFAPLAARATDCRVVVDRDRPERPAVDCPDAGDGPLSFAFSLAAPATVSVAVEVTEQAPGPAGSGASCPEDLEQQPPRVLLSGLELSSDGCRGALDGAARYSVLYRAPEPLPAGPWTLAVCPRSGGGPAVQSAVVTSTPLTPSDGPAPPDDQDTAAAPGDLPGMRMQGGHDPAFPCPTAAGGAAGG